MPSLSVFLNTSGNLFVLSVLISLSALSAKVTEAEEGRGNQTREKKIK